MNFNELFSEHEIQVLQERARRVASAANDRGEHNALSVLLLRLNGERYAMPIDKLTAVYEGIAVVPVPCTPPFVSGIANVRGYMISILDLAHLLDVPDDDVEDQNVLIVVSNETMRLGYRVDQIGEVRNFAKDELASVPANFDNGAYVKHILPDGTALLDIDALLDDPRIIVDETLN